ncbi:hypothetical protein COCON_G00091420 [Conger conger]|uniref:Uncharacterized protein n=1 Tax=Conger conger TaxID=82655 RepID=A0A9Q1DL17_CONCO|nr:hypothetical protein COCON_G00091420 [Conger conger]
MDLMPEGGPKQRLSTDLAALSSDKKYVYVGLSNSEKSLENCSMAGSKAEKEAPMPEPEATVPVISTIKEDQCNITAADLKRNSTKNNDSPKVNFMLWCSNDSRERETELASSVKQKLKCLK